VTATTSPTSPAVLRSPVIGTLLAEIGAGAAERELRDESPFAQVAVIARARLGALSLPVSEGGQGASIREVLAFVTDLAEADPIVAHVLRTHYSQVLGFLRLTDPDVRRRWLDEVRAGKVFGNAISETGAVSAGSHEFATRLDEVGGRLVLNGTKYYSTGTMYSDWIAVVARVEGSAYGPSGGLATVLVPADREGVDVVDDWDGMGQRRTGTGTTSFRDVVVARDEVLGVRDRLTPRPAGDVPFLQLYLHAVIAGILRSVVADAAELVRSRSRTFDHGVRKWSRSHTAPTCSISSSTSPGPVVSSPLATLSASAWTRFPTLASWWARSTPPASSRQNHCAGHRAMDSRTLAETGTGRSGSRKGSRDRLGARVPHQVAGSACATNGCAWAVSAASRPYSAPVLCPTCHGPSISLPRHHILTR